MSLPSQALQWDISERKEEEGEIDDKLDVSCQSEGNTCKIIPVHLLFELVCCAFSEKQEFVLTVTACNDDGNAGPEEGIDPIGRSSGLPGAIVLASEDMMKVSCLLIIEFNSPGGRTSMETE